MKFLKIAILFSLLNLMFFGGFLYILNLQKQSQQQIVQSSVVQANPQTPIASASGSTQAVQPVKATAAPSLKGAANNQAPAQAAPASSAPATPSSTPPPASDPAPAVPTPTPVPTPNPILANRCIIVIKGQKYDVTDFRNTHSGGDIFACGTDMTQTFFNQHNQQLLDGPIMQGLKVN